MASSAQRAVVAGASGFIGQRLVHDLSSQGYSVSTIGRSVGDARWGDTAAIRSLIDGADLLINLAGKSVNCRYTETNRDEIVRSRIDTTRELREAVAAAPTPPRVWLNASTSTIYRYAFDRPMTETDGALGSGFSVDVARAWEAEFFAGDLPGTRRVALRLAIVLGDGPATGLLLRLARLGVGGPQFDGWWLPHRRYRGIGAPAAGPNTAPGHVSRGRQKFSWIHIDDVLGSIRFLIEHDEIAGAVNLAAPEVSDNRSLMATLRRAVGSKGALPAFRWMLEPAMWLLRTEPELVLKSRWVLPERLLQAGYRFTWPSLTSAVRDVARR
ncbi:DUF1731 domain-containing protein [Cryobacterium melibiosiphilum]|uniref:DUF1731 domain-containing protein n=1 Tax=Cryobacterium melibiosiphilum TaxID=995039 RepID=A0A3A5MTA4_9MICO|nr:DUF1731 domain-containing protein [Cryobacterium melibiosiphilum]RJT89186.1 DUF1731 domain-containing protein [Cryobacterium melibiosiphilum]